MADQNKGMSDLWRRLRFVFMAIVVYRLGTHIPIPGIDPADWRLYLIRIKALSSRCLIYFLAVH